MILKIGIWHFVLSQIEIDLGKIADILEIYSARCLWEGIIWHWYVSNSSYVNLKIKVNNLFDEKKKKKLMFFQTQM